MPGNGNRDRTKDAALRRARTCYDHLAGQLAATMADRMIERGRIELSTDGGVITEVDTAFLRGLGIDLDASAARSARRGSQMFCRSCLDWSERRPYIAGRSGGAVLLLVASPDAIWSLVVATILVHMGQVIQRAAG